MAPYDDTADLGEERVRALFIKLSEDDDLRSAFEADPGKVLKEHGIELDPAQVPEKSKLPSKEQLRSGLDSYLESYREQPRTQLAFAAFQAE